MKDLIKRQIWSGLFSYDTEAADFEKKERAAKGALKFAEKFFGQHHPNFAVGLIRLADTYGEKGDYRKSKQLYEQAIKLLENRFDPKHPAIGIALRNLSELPIEEEMDRKALSSRARQILNANF